MLSASNPQTGLLPDWLNSDFTSAAIPWDSNKDSFYYDASRVPIRLLLAQRLDGMQWAPYALSLAIGLMMATLYMRPVLQNRRLPVAAALLGLAAALSLSAYLAARVVTTLPLDEILVWRLIEGVAK